ncbi:hypothetical protein CSAL01_09899 [Colletotrichum salicis]|uniref:Uncharacterized protein n=1 Tax=Colletotrichum salicis TaxID=1209931 RepID=A0A135T3D7_9PEZI|nr:hypothetical protein CSAL01_09899 [Colletotrichum salicis]
MPPTGVDRLHGYEGFGALDPHYQLFAGVQPADLSHADTEARRAGQAKAEVAYNATAQMGQNTRVLSRLSPDLPAEEKIDERLCGEADVSLAAVTETIATMLDLVYVLYAEEYGCPGEDGRQILGRREIWKRCKID